MGGVYRGGRRARVSVRTRGGGLELRVDGTFASFLVPGRATTGSVWDALAAPLLLLPPRRRRRVLVLGLGGGSAARLVRALAPAAHVVGVELDAEVLRVARRRLGLDALGLEVVRADAREYLAAGRPRFDAILEDVFVGRGRGVRKPDWLPEPGLALAARRVAPGGILVSNALDEAPAVERVLGRLFPGRLRVEVTGYDNRIVVGGAVGLSARDLRRRARAEPLLAHALPRLSFRTL
jgi:spermidine synthase